MGDPQIAGWLEAARRLAEAPDDAAALAWLATAPPPPERPAPLPPSLAGPADLSGHPAPLPPVAWHAARLRALAAAGDPVERRYHARWLWHLLAPEEPASWPLISVVIPVYNRHDLMQEAIASVLADGYPRLELCLCDDGSASDPWPLLQSFGLGERLRYRRLAANAGVAIARQAALELASGELVRFLDTDDLLLPGGLADQVAALAAVPDAELCFTQLAQEVVDPKPGERPEPRRVGRPTCPSQEGAPSMVRRLPFLPSAVLVARHRMLAVGFDPGYRFHEDRLAFGRLAIAGIKCVGLKRPRTLRRWLPSSATRVLKDTVGDQARVNLALLHEALPHPRLWSGCGPLVGQLFDSDWRPVTASRRPEELAAGLEVLLRRLEALGPVAGLSPAPLLADLAAGLAAVLAREAPDPLGDETLARLRAAAASAPAPGRADLAHWQGVPDPAINAGALGCLFTALSAALRRGERWVPLALLDRKPFRSLPHPAKRRWKLLARLARTLGEGPARAAARLLG